MPKEIKFNKYKLRSSSYHWQQIAKNIFTFNAYVSARYRQVVNQVPHQKNLKILDIGCGDGVLLYLINRKAKADLTGVDLDADSLEIAKTKLKAIFVKSSATKIPFNPNLFDLVIASEIIEHLVKPEKMLTEIKRVLKPKGKVIITTPVKLFSKPEDPMHIQEFSTTDLNFLLKQYFPKVLIKTSHPYWLKKIYTTPWLKLNHFYFEPVKWFINLLYFIFGLNLFYLKGPRPSQQLAISEA